MFTWDQIMKTLSCHAKGCDLHMADHKKLSKILIQAPVGPGSV